MGYRRIIIILIAIIAMNSGLFAQEQLSGERVRPARRDRSERPERSSRGPSSKERWESLNLTEAQKTAIETINTEFRTSMSVLRTRLEAKNAERRVATENSNFDEMRLITGQLNDIRNEMSQMRITHVENIFNQLTAEQREKLKESRGNYKRRPVRIEAN